MEGEKMAFEKRWLPVVMKEIDDMVNTMIISARLPFILWGEVLITAFHVHNRVLSKKIQFPFVGNVKEVPNTYSEVMASRDAAFWREAVNDEMDSILSNNTWVLVDLPPSSNTIGCKWVFRRKYRTDGTIQTFKARLVAKGFRQREGIDYFDTYAPVARITSIRVLIALASIY
jgi:hypothetical protein